jgi:hypothetical protein
MPNTSRNHRVRQIVLETFRQLGAAATETPSETTLIRDGYYCGNRFMLDDFEAVWFVEENQIKFYGPDGGLLQVVKPGMAVSVTQAKAA